MAPCVIVVGSENPAKLRAVSLAINQLRTTKAFSEWDDFIIRGAKVSSTVRAQPMSDEETCTGAIARARAALAVDADATFAVGLEGGVQQVGNKWFECGFIAVVNRKGQIGLGTSARYELSAGIIEGLKQGEELGDVVDRLSGERDNRSNLGAMGLVSVGLLPRDLCYSHGVIFAFGPFISPSIYWN